MKQMLEGPGNKPQSFGWSHLSREGSRRQKENSQGPWEVQTRAIRKAKTVSASSPGSEEAGTGNKEGCSEEHVLKRSVEGKPLRGGGSYPSKAQTWCTEGWESKGVT